MKTVRVALISVSALAALGGGAYACTAGADVWHSGGRPSVTPPPRGCDHGRGLHLGCGHHGGPVEGNGHGEHGGHEDD